jgi:hypothetical protein
MSTHYMIVSNPPHGSADAAKAAVYFGLTAAEARMKMNFPAPEIWLTDSDRQGMAGAQASLAECGVNTVLLEGEDLLKVPHQNIVSTFSMGDSQLVMQTAEGEKAVDCDSAIHGVFCKPATDVFMGTRKGANLAGDLGRPSSSVMLDRLSHTSSGAQAESVKTGIVAFLDLYASADGEDRRFSFVAGTTDFSALQSVGRDPLYAFVVDCERHFSSISLDRRLENVRVRARAVVGKPIPGEEQRKLFSFGSMALAKLLDEISPDLHELTQNELGSRLSYLMKQ